MKKKNVAFNPFYKVIVLNIDIFNSEIIDERHFETEQEAQAFIDNIQKPGIIGLIIDM